MIAVISIKPKYADMIIKGEKKYELRKRAFKRNVEIVYAYVTKPVGRVMFSFRPKRIVTGSPDMLWKSVGHLSGLTEREFSDYFRNTHCGMAIEIDDVVTYAEDPILLSKPPRSWVYCANSKQEVYCEGNNCYM